MTDTKIKEICYPIVPQEIHNCDYPILDAGKIILANGHLYEDKISLSGTKWRPIIIEQEDKDCLYTKLIVIYASDPKQESISKTRWQEIQ